MGTCQSCGTSIGRGYKCFKCIDRQIYGNSSGVDQKVEEYFNNPFIQILLAIAFLLFFTIINYFAYTDGEDFNAKVILAFGMSILYLHLIFTVLAWLRVLVRHEFYLAVIVLISYIGIYGLAVQLFDDPKYKKYFIGGVVTFILQIAFLFLGFQLGATTSASFL